jgi:HEAT repeat protein
MNRFAFASAVSIALLCTVLTPASAGEGRPKPGARQSVEDLIRIATKKLPLKSRENTKRLAAVEELRRRGSRRAVPALIKLAAAPTATQDFFLTKRAMVALGVLGDKRAVPVLIRGLFRASTVQGTSWKQARIALVRIGKPAVTPLLRALRGRNKALLKMAKRRSFRPGVILNKTAIVLGDLRDRSAVRPLLRRLAKADPTKTRAAGLIEALGKIGDRRATKPLIALLRNKRANYKIRMQLCNALTVLGDKRALPALLHIAEKGFIQGGYYNLREGGAMAWGRLVGAEVRKGIKRIDAMLADPKIKKYRQTWSTFKQAKDRALIAIKCGDNATCYGKALNNPKRSLAQREKAAIMLGALGKRSALPYLVKALPIREPILRLFMLESAKRLGKRGDKALVATLRKLAKQDGGRKTRFLGADLASADEIALAVVLRKR